MLRQSRHVAMLDGRIDDIEKASLGDLRAAVARVKDPKLTAETPGVFLGAPAKYWLDLRGYDPPAEAAKVAAPMLGVALAIGLTVSLVQALTQMQEMTLSFVPKIAVMAVTLFLFMTYMRSTLIIFGERLFERIAGLG